MRIMKATLAILFLAGLIGCDTCKDRPVQRTVQIRQPFVGPQTNLPTTLLFDATPGYYLASDFAYRSDWPATDSFYSTGQVIFYRERFIDYQGPHYNHRNHTYRRFESYRTGTAYR